MRGKSEQSSINETSTNNDVQPIPSNPREEDHEDGHIKINEEQQQVVYRKSLLDAPPSYTAAVQSPSDPTRIQPHKPVGPNQRPPLVNRYIWPRHSTNAACPTCNATVVTRVETSSTIITFALAILLFIFCCIFGLLPFCIPACKKTIHYCPNCSRILGKRDEFE